MEMETRNNMTQAIDPEAQTKMAKLRLEVEELQWKVRWAYKVGQFVSVITAFLAIGAVLVSIYQINAAYEQDFKKPVWERQLRILGEISESAAAIAVLPAGTEDRKKAELKFEQLFWGPVAITENNDLKNAMVEFTKCMNGTTPDCECYAGEEQTTDGKEISDCAAKKTRLQDLSMVIAEKCRMKVGSIWDITSLKSKTDEPDEPSDTPTPAPEPTPVATELP